MTVRNQIIMTLAAPALLMAVSALAAGTHAQADHEIGKAGLAARVTRTVNVDMLDTMRYSPASVAVKKGETVRFVIKNSGQLTHEMVLGTEKDLKEHHEAMKKSPEMEHADANMLTLKPGKSGEIVWQFTNAGAVSFACLQPGHYDAGMKGLVTVASAKATPKHSGGKY